MTDIDHIFFDLDHTLWDFEYNSLETLGELFVLFKLDQIGGKVKKEYFVDRYVFHNERMWTLYRQNRLSKSRLRSARFEYALRDIGIEEKRMAKEFGAAYVESCPKKSKLKDGAMETVQALSKVYPLSVLSNGFQESQLTKLDSSGLTPFFKEVITSERASAKKPNSRIFHFANEVTDSRREHSIMIGDHLDIDVEGARSYGWRGIHYSEKKSADQDSIQHLTELIRLLL